MLTLEYFMWGYQAYFQVGVEIDAKALLDKIAPRLSANVLLVGVLQEEEEGWHPICIEPEPEECGVYPETFDGVTERAKKLFEEDKESRIICTDPEHQRAFIEGVRNRSLCYAIRNCLEENHLGAAFFVSMPRRLDKYKVSTVLRVDAENLSSYYQLAKSEFTYGLKYRIYTSLIDAVIDEFLMECSAALARPDPGKYFRVLALETDEMIRRAGRALMGTAATAGQSRPHPGSRLFEACNEVSSLSYEGTASAGRMIIARREHPNVSVHVLLRQPVPLSEHRAIRKLVEITTPDLSLLTDAELAYGFGSLEEGYAKDAEDLFAIDFLGLHKWELTHAENTLMRVSYGLPHLPVSRLDPAKLQDIFARMFPEASQADTELIWELVESLWRGSMAVYWYSQVKRRRKPSACKRRRR